MFPSGNSTYNLNGLYTETFQRNQPHYGLIGVLYFKFILTFLYCTKYNDFLKMHVNVIRLENAINNVSYLVTGTHKGITLQVVAESEFLVAL